MERQSLRYTSRSQPYKATITPPLDHPIDLSPFSFLPSKNIPPHHIPISILHLQSSAKNAIQSIPSAALTPKQRSELVRPDSAASSPPTLAAGSGTVCSYPINFKSWHGSDTNICGMKNGYFWRESLGCG